jgi:polysaccharide biosynthesis protein PslH
MRVKIVDAWSHSVPIVSTTIGAEGLAYQHGENILIADTPGSFVEAIQLLAHDPSLWQKLSQNGWETVEQHYQWDKVYAPLDKIYP